MIAQLPHDVLQRLPEVAARGDLMSLRETCCSMRDVLQPLQWAGSEDVGRKVAAFVIGSGCGWHGIRGYVQRSNLCRLKADELARLEHFSFMCGMRDGGRAFDEVRLVFDAPVWEGIVRDFVEFVLRALDYHLWVRLADRLDAVACAYALRILWLVDF